ncbi:MAG: hypothetical protein Q4F21_07735 [Lachnospiraceae bacterium]|nr:hypothetical protein [Lachnospiraceae bacterium]
MHIDNSIIKSYLQGSSSYKSHWIFDHILDNGEYIFEEPKKIEAEKVRNIYEKIQKNLTSFIPFNVELFSMLFSDWENKFNDINIVLAVGCPSPFDAMVRQYNGREYMVFDLVRFLDYEQQGKDILSVIIGMITHETAHICIHADHSIDTCGYQQQLSYITFDEGFAHLLAFTDQISKYDFCKIIEMHYEGSLQKLKAALSEEDFDQQKKYLQQSNCGAYWDKFAAISGKLYLASHMDHLCEIYKAGPSAMIHNMLE